MLLGACGNATTDDGDAATGEATADIDSGYVGTLNGTDAFVGLVVSGSNAGAYACDGDGAFTETLTLPGGVEHAFTTERAVGDAGTYLIVGEQAVAAGVSAGWIIENDGAERSALLRNGSFRSTPKFDSSGLVLEDEGFAMTRLVVDTDAEQQTFVTASEIVAPDNVLRVPSPAGPIPIPIPMPNTPLPNEDLTKKTNG